MLRGFACVASINVVYSTKIVNCLTRKHTSSKNTNRVSN